MEIEKEVEDEKGATSEANAMPVKVSNHTTTGKRYASEGKQPHNYRVNAMPVKVSATTQLPG